MTRLRRPLYARLFGTVIQTILTLYALGTLATVALAIYAPLVHKSFSLFSWWLIPDVLLTLVWLRGATAWTSFDDEGVHTRYFVRFDYPWATMHSVTLQRLGEIYSARTPGAPAIVIRTKKPSDDETKLAPVLRCGRRRTEFATALAAAARAHGVTVVVGSTGWNEAQEREVDFYEG